MKATDGASTCRTMSVCRAMCSYTAMAVREVHARQHDTVPPPNATELTPKQSLRLSAEGTHTIRSATAVTTTQGQMCLTF